LREIVRGANPTILRLTICQIPDMRLDAVANLAAVKRIAGVVDNLPNL
jgi:hypothetical protein